MMMNLPSVRGLADALEGTVGRLGLATRT